MFNLSDETKESIEINTGISYDEIITSADLPNSSYQDMVIDGYPIRTMDYVDSRIEELCGITYPDIDFIGYSKRLGKRK